MKDSADSKRISTAVISRLPKYYRYLGEIMEEGVDKISSKELSERMHVTASQIRQDLNNFGGFGQQGYGYNVEHLYKEIGKILGIDTVHNLIVVGAGNLAKALINYSNFEKRGFLIKAMFDNNPDVVGKIVKDKEILSIGRLESYIRDNNIQMAILCIPKTESQAMTDTLVSYGIKAIWNFSHTDLKVPDDVVVESVHLSESLMKLSYMLHHNQEEKTESEE